MCCWPKKKAAKDLDWRYVLPKGNPAFELRGCFKNFDSRLLLKKIQYHALENVLYLMTLLSNVGLILLRKCL